MKQDKPHRILVTGATGNIGTAVVHQLAELNTASQIIAAVRNIDKGKKHFKNPERVSFRRFDFESPATFTQAFEQIDVLFLLRPPHISDIPTFFEPLLRSAKQANIQSIVFLSVQGAEKSKVIPHNKIERLIQNFGFRYIFVRPSYFMQNLTTTLLPEIISQKSITLPSGNAKFNWVDVNDIGAATALLIVDFESYANQAIEITGLENLSFGAVAQLISAVIEQPVVYQSVNPISFYLKKRKLGMPSDFALVMTMLHFLPRIQGEPKVSDSFAQITGRAPIKVMQFLEREKAIFETSN